MFKKSENILMALRVTCLVRSRR